MDAWGPKLRSGDVVIAGDFNSDAIWDNLHGDRSHTALVRRLESDFGLVSAYHSIRGEAHGAEKEKTFHMHGKDEFTYHIDYAFIPRSWQTRVRTVELATGETWHALSDHRPLTVEVV